MGKCAEPDGQVEKRAFVLTVYTDRSVALKSVVF